MVNYVIFFFFFFIALPIKRINDISVHVPKPYEMTLKKMFAYTDTISLAHSAKNDDRLFELDCMHHVIQLKFVYCRKVCVYPHELEMTQSN